MSSHESEDRTIIPATSRATTMNGKKGGKSKRNKPLTLKSMPQKRRKSLNDVIYESICERTIIAQKRSCIEMAQAKIKFTKDLLELGINSTDEVKAMVTEHFSDK
ncbi:hypothetical protein PR003_g23731 [Phytophthora rubi]|uniref:Uncharacterized protein n=1 Tax=Phytophthora rubi TaxID=129364 RepID=A0A6A4D4I1_9STRA|nr:hypothetical protein PR001_g22530 [Phytophthora rubi]KAE9296559.1 hypothetical protein PR003_g23731 [Phytophthora rubi]